MKVGDLVHNPRYPYWGLGMIVDLEEETGGLVCVYWFDEDTKDADWRERMELETL